MSDEAWLGIDFGTSNSTMAFYNASTGTAEEIFNAEGEIKTPSTVYIGETEILVGKLADVCFEDTRKWGRIFRKVKLDLAKENFVRCLDRKVWRPPQIVAEVLKKLKKDAEKGVFHEEVKRAVITYPACFDEIQKGKLGEAAQLAGLEEVELLPEPVAAALAFLRIKGQIGRSVLVYDFGGGTFDAAVVIPSSSEGGFRLVCRPRGVYVGGEVFDELLYKHFEKSLGRSFSDDGYDLDFLRRCRTYKENLCTGSHQSQLSYHSRVHNKFFKFQITLEEFESLIEKHVDETIKVAKNLVEEATNNGNKPETVILIGGSSRIPLVKRRLQEVFGLEPLMWHKCDVAVAIGAAFWAHEKWGKATGHLGTPHARSEDNTEDLGATCANDGAQYYFDCAQKQFENAKKNDDRTERNRILQETLKLTVMATDSNPNFLKALLLRGRVHFEMKEWEAAEAAYTAALRLDPKNIEALENRFRCRWHLQKFQEAYSDAKSLGPLWPPKAFMLSSIAQRWMGDQAACITELQNALNAWDNKLSQDDYRCLLAILGILLFDNRDYGEAYERLITAFQVQINPVRWEDLCFWYGLSDWAEGRGKNSDTALKQSIASKAWQSLKNSRPREGKSDLVERFIRDFPDSTCYLAIIEEERDFGYYVIETLVKQGDSATAVEALKKLFKSHPDYDVNTILRSKWIRSCNSKEIKDFLYPRLEYRYKAGLFSNYIWIANVSPFSMSNIVVRVLVHRNNGTWSQFSRKLSVLRSHQTHRWENVFTNPGLFGANIMRVEVCYQCKEKDNWTSAFAVET
jgi:actin-like ATPase involved in cell morphogenesis/tetratricopeptide (TPR) repeat protein